MIATRWNNLKNLRMAEKLSEGESFDISGCERTSDGSYILTGILAEEAERAEGTDFCDAKTESWVWSIGKNIKTGQVVAALDARYYQNPEYNCLWLR
jgi:hypothetical protein